MIEFEIDGNQYRAEKLELRTQSHVARRLIPLVPKLAPLTALPAILAAREPPRGETESDVPSGSAPAASAAVLAMFADLDLNLMFGPIAEAIAGMPDADWDYVIDECLGVCKRVQSGGAWAPIWNRQARRTQFDDINLITMVKIVIRTLDHSVGGFFAALPSNSGAPKAS